MKMIDSIGISSFFLYTLLFKIKKKNYPRSIEFQTNTHFSFFINFFFFCKNEIVCSIYSANQFVDILYFYMFYHTLLYIFI